MPVSSRVDDGASTADVTAASFAHEPIFWKLDEGELRGPIPLIPKASLVTQPGADKQGESRAEGVHNAQVRKL